MGTLGVLSGNIWTGGVQLLSNKGGAMPPLLGLCCWVYVVGFMLSKKELRACQYQTVLSCST